MRAQAPRPRVAAWVAALIGLNTIVLANALLHDPFVGYDGAEHLKYIEAMSGLRWPLRADTLEFFSPPLPYLLPAMLRSTGLVSLWGAGKAAQLINAGCSILLTLCLVRICERLRPGHGRLKLGALLLLGMLPVYSKSFAMVRGEPMLACLALLCLESALGMLDASRRLSGRALQLGLLLGLAALSRQWGFFLLPAVAGLALIVMRADAARRRALAAALAVSFAVAGVTAGWFYLHLRSTFGTLRAFNRTPVGGFSPANHPGEFYTGAGWDRFFTDPIRPAFGVGLAPIFHSETWGDYWGAFLVRGIDSRDGRMLYGGELHLALQQQPAPSWLQTNRYSIAPYLGRANLAGLAPSLLLLAGWIGAAGSIWKALRGAGEAHPAALLFLTIGFSAAGYAWFLLSYPRADTIKATYMLQVFPCLAILGADLLERLRQRSLAAHRAVATLVALCALHNAPLLITRFGCC